MLAKELQEKVRVCCETAEAYKKHSRLYIEKAQTGQEYAFLKKTL